MSRATFFVLSCVIATGLANPATQLPCLDVKTQCEVTNVDITPCAKKDRCLFTIGKTASISFDFTPEFDASELEHDVSTKVPGIGIVQSFAGLEKDACKSTTCPVSAGKKQSFTYNLHLNRRDVTKGTYDIKWQLWNKAQPDQKCCFVTLIRLK